MSTIAHPLVEAKGLVKSFALRSQAFERPVSVRALDQVDIEVYPGETVAVVGESGSGKSTLGRALLMLDPPTSGSVRFDGQELVGLAEKALRPLRRRMQMVFQDPFGSLNPRMTVRDILAEPFLIHGLTRSSAELESTLRDLLDSGRLPRTADARYPKQFSGGQRQRVSIARALALSPDFVVADEPVSALDVSIQAQILRLLAELRQARGLASLFIAHKLAVVRLIADRVVVRYFGRVVSSDDRDSRYERAAHPYSRALIDASPVPDPAIEASRSRITLPGDVPSPSVTTSGCVCRSRCSRAAERCAQEVPPRRTIDTGHRVAGHFPIG
ncbi:MAG: ABC transporter ATP-binding protein, partial [Betaproteobacteria bacterium]